MENTKRCSWLNLNNETYVKYHDEEWGKPLYDDKKLYEILILQHFPILSCFICEEPQKAKF